MISASRSTLCSTSVRVYIFVSLAFLSGLCALAYEVLYVRALTTVFGDMLHVHAALLSTFLIGIGIGAKFAYRFVKWLYLFEILTGVLALILPLLLNWLSQQTILVNISSKPLITIALTSIFICLPSLCIGFSIPLFSAYIKNENHNKLAFQNIYQAYNIGGLLGLLFVELTLVKLLGISKSLAVIGIVNIFNGLLLMLIGSASKLNKIRTIHKFPKKTVIALALISLGSASYQMFFLKSTYLIFEPHRENFAIGLAVTMLGIALGAILASKIKIRFETLLLLIPISLGITYINFLPIVQTGLNASPWESGSQLQILFYKFTFSCVFALVPMILFGATIPSLMQKESNVEGESGHLLFIASVANAIGYLAYVIIGHPYFDSNVVLAFIACLAFIAALIVIGKNWNYPQLACTFLGIILTIVNFKLWKEEDFYLAQWANSNEDISKIKVYKSGSDSVTYVRTPQYNWVTYNGHPSIYISNDHKVNFAEMVSGVLPAINSPRLGNALVLGLGTGITAGTAAELFDHTAVVEINKAFFELLPEIRYANMDILKNAKASLYQADGRAFLIGKESKYDAIINSIPAPTYFSASKIYTVEFYELVKKALKPDGIFNTWFAVPNMSEQGVRVILSALHKSFEYCNLNLLRDNYFMASCSNQVIKRRSFEDLSLDGILATQLRRSLPNFDLNEYFEDILISDNIFEKYTPSIKRENTDDDPVLEFMLVRNYQVDRMGEDLFSQQQKLFNIDPARFAKAVPPDRFSRRAGIYYLYNHYYFEKNFKPIFSQLDQYENAWDNWEKSLATREKH